MDSPPSSAATFVTCQFVVWGKVQGVGYRNYVSREARFLNLKGWVRNLEDGTVEVLAEGLEESIGRLIEKCRLGPSTSKVDKIEIRSQKKVKPSLSAGDFVVLR